MPADALDAHTARWVLAGQRTGALRSGVYSPLLPRETVDTAPLAASLDTAAARVAQIQDQMLTADPAAIGALAAVLARATADRDALRKQLDAANAEIERATSFDAMLSEWGAMTTDGRRGILRRLTAAGWHFQLRPFVEGEPAERVMIFNERDLADDAA